MEKTAPIPKADTVYRSRRTNQRYYIYEMTELYSELDGFYLVTVVREEDVDDMSAIADEMDPKQWAYFYFGEALEFVESVPNPVLRP